MTQRVPDPSRLPQGIPSIQARRVSSGQRLSAAMRLVGQNSGDIEIAAKRLVSSAPVFGIDLSLIWVTLTDDSRQVRQACLTVPGAGRTAMFFLSEPHRKGEIPSKEVALAERVACVNAALRDLPAIQGDRVQVAQALPEQSETWAIAAWKASGFTTVGNLTYLRRPALTELSPVAPLPQDLSLVRYSDLPKTEADQELLKALSATYEETLDCPELCGLRSPEDILESHRSTGSFDPALWWILRSGSSPVGCVLMNPCPEQRCVELVYIGLAVLARGRRLSATLLRLGIAEANRVNPGWSVTCAVDTRNEPAKRLYARFGFEAFSERVAFVKTLALK